MSNANYEPAFPIKKEPMTFSEKSPIYLGLTKREYFAAKAMQGLCAASAPMTNEIIAADAVRIADALIDSLTQQESEK